MEQNSNLLLKNFLKDYFPIRKIKNKNGKWTRVIIINSGYIRNTNKIYNWNRNLDVNLVAVDLSKILVNVFSCTENEAKSCVVNYIQKIAI